MRFSWFTFAGPRVVVHRNNVSPGVEPLQPLIMPFPVTWLGRHAKGCMQMMFPPPIQLARSSPSKEPALPCLVPQS